MKFNKIVFIFLGALIIVSCGSDNGNEIALNNEDPALLERPDTPRPTMFAKGTYMDQLASRLATDVNIPDSDGKYISTDTAFCYADAQLNLVPESVLKENDVNNQNVTSKINQVAEIDNYFELLGNCMNSKEIVEFYNEITPGTETEISCAIDKIGIETVRKEMIKFSTPMKDRIEKEATSCTN